MLIFLIIYFTHIFLPINSLELTLQMLNLSQLWALLIDKHFLFKDKS